MVDDVAMTGEETRSIAVADSEAPGSLQTREDDLGAPDGAPGTPQTAAKANGAAREAGPAKRKGGRAKGSPKVPGSGRRKGAPNALGKVARQWLAANSNYLDVIARTCAGKPVKMAGPTGKQVWRYPDWADRRWAIELVARKLNPDVSASEISGPDGEPVAITDGEPLDIREIARRLALIFSQADPGNGGDA